MADGQIFLFGEVFHQLVGALVALDLSISDRKLPDDLMPSALRSISTSTTFVIRPGCEAMATPDAGLEFIDIAEIGGARGAVARLPRRVGASNR